MFILIQSPLISNLFKEPYLLCQIVQIHDARIALKQYPIRFRNVHHLSLRSTEAEKRLFPQEGSCRISHYNKIDFYAALCGRPDIKFNAKAGSCA